MINSHTHQQSNIFQVENPFKINVYVFYIFYNF